VLRVGDRANSPESECAFLRVCLQVFAVLCFLKHPGIHLIMHERKSLEEQEAKTIPPYCVCV